MAVGSESSIAFPKRHFGGLCALEYLDGVLPVCIRFLCLHLVSTASDHGQGPHFVCIVTDRTAL